MVRLNILLDLYLNRQHKWRILASRTRLRSRISSHSRRRRDRRISRRALQHPSMSGFMTLFVSGCDQSLITLTEFDHRSFRDLLRMFEPVYYSYTPYSEDGRIRKLPAHSSGRGRQRTMKSMHCLALFLAWGRTRGSEFMLSITFGVTGTVASLFIRIARRIIIRMLSNNPLAAVKMPSDAEVVAYQEVILAKYPLLKKEYAVADGLKLTLEQSGDIVIQNMFYNGWTHDHYVGNAFVLAPSGVIICCAINAPGSMHDSMIAEFGNVYTKLKTIFDRCGGQCIVDSAFAKGEHLYLIKSAQDFLIGAEENVDVSEARQATSVRQASEWGMRALQGTFPRIKDRMIYEDHGERKKILESIILLFNMRTRLVGINQILSAFMLHLSVEANELLISIS